MQCEHLERITVRTSDVTVCAECIAKNDSWVHLRLCMDCGHVGCCDSSKNRHATKHASAEHHLIVRSLEPGEAWIWCRAHNAVVAEVGKSEVRK